VQISLVKNFTDTCRLYYVVSYFKIVVVPDGETAKKVPAVPGLLEYRKDNKELYVRANETWKAIVSGKKVSFRN
jgi:hypothetical protein